MSAVTRIRTWVIAATTQCTNHYTITAVIPAYVKQIAEFKNGFKIKNKTNKKKPNNNNNEGNKEQKQEKNTKKQNDNI